MSLNCPHAWEEYKKLDTAHDALRREYLALRGEQMDFANVPKDWLEKMRGLRGRCLTLDEGKKSFLQDFDENCSSKVFEETKLAILQNKIFNNLELEKRDLRFLYSIDRWPSDETEKALGEIIKTRDNKYKDLSKALGCREDQISFTYDEFEKGKDIIYHWGALDFNNTDNAHDLKLPKYVRGPLRLNRLTSVYGLVWPKSVGGLELSGLESAQGLHLPKSIKKLSLYNLESLDGLILPSGIKELNLSGLRSAEGLILPPSIMELSLPRLKSAKGLNLPQGVKYLYLNNLTSAKDLVLPTHIEKLHLNDLTSTDGLVLPQSVEKLELGSLILIDGLILSPNVKYLRLNHLTNSDGLDLSNCNNKIRLDRLPNLEKDKLRTKYPHLADKIE